MIRIPIRIRWLVGLASAVTVIFPCLLWMGAAGASELSASSLEPFDPGRAGFVVRVRGEVNPYRVLAVSVLPGDKVPIELVGPWTGGELSGGFDLLDGSGQILGRLEPGTMPGTARRVVWTAPRESGFYPLELRDRAGILRMRLHLLVLVPFSEVRDGWLNGYRIGIYPTTPLRGLAVYRAPRGFIEVTEDLLDLEVSPHFRLRQFLCKQEGGWPRYVILRERLLLKLEYLLQVVNAKGYRASTFEVLSGFRTPWYNRAIGNVQYSRHQWGGAADIFLDESPRDGRMDDLNGDGRIDGRDADLLYDLFDGLGVREDYATQFTGGLGKYGPNPVRGPFVHVDARGFRARWGR